MLSNRDLPLIRTLTTFYQISLHVIIIIINLLVDMKRVLLDDVPATLVAMTLTV